MKRLVVGNQYSRLMLNLRQMTYESQVRLPPDGTKLVKWKTVEVRTEESMRREHGTLVT